MPKLLQRSSFPVAPKIRNYRSKGAQPLFLLVIVSTVESDTRSGRARRGFERAPGERIEVARLVERESRWQTHATADAKQAAKISQH